MKIRRSIFLISAAAIVLTLFLIWFGRKPLGTASSESANTPNAAVAKNLESPAMRPISRIRQVQQNNLETTNLAPDVPQTVSGDPRRGLAALNDVPIVFYGKLEDQFGNAVGNATVNFSVRVYNGFRSGVDRGQLASDANGLFTISGYKGESLSVVPEKSGYVPVSIEGSGIYSYMWPEEQRAHPDPNDPTIIKMWKLQGAEPLISIDQHHRFPFTNTSIRFDLPGKRIVSEDGDLKLTIHRPEGIISEQHPQDWSIDIEAVDGGLIQTSDKEWGVTYSAPEGGYQMVRTFTKNTGVGSFDGAFFLKSRNGQVYSKLWLSFQMNIQPADSMFIALRGYANTNGSRNWEATIPKQ